MLATTTSKLCLQRTTNASTYLLSGRLVSFVSRPSFRLTGRSHQQTRGHPLKHKLFSTTSSTPPKKNIFLDNLGGIFLGGIGFIIAWLVRSYMGSQARNKIRDSIEEASLLDPLELDDLRAANSELTATHLLEVFDDVKQQSQEYFTYKEFVDAARQALTKRKTDWTIQLGHLLDRAAMLALERRGKSIANDEMPLLFWFTILSMALSGSPEERIQTMYKVLNDSTTADGALPNESVTELVSYLQDTCQLVPDAQVVATTTKYPVQQYAIAAPIELVDRYRAQSKLDRPNLVSNEDELRDILTSHSICAWGECYKLKR